MDHSGPRFLRVCISLFIVLAALGSAGAAELPLITIQKTDVPLSQVLADISTQTGVEILVPQSADLTATLDLDLTEADIEAALREVASQANCSWVRTYLLEPKEGDSEEYTFSGLLQLIRKDPRRPYVRRMDPLFVGVREDGPRPLPCRAPTRKLGSGIPVGRYGDMGTPNQNRRTCRPFLTDRCIRTCLRTRIPHPCGDRLRCDHADRRPDKEHGLLLCLTLAGGTAASRWGSRHSS